jgi:hypothetical protein
MYEESISDHRLLSIEVLVMTVLRFSSVGVIDRELGAEFLIMLIILLGAMFLLLVELALTGGDAAACAKPSILLFLGRIVFF